MKSLSDVKLKYCFPKNIKSHFFLAIYNFNQQCYWKIYARRWIDPKGIFVYSLVFSDKKNQIPKILPMWVFVPLKCRQNFEILLVWILTPHTFQKKCPWCMTFAQAIVFQSYFIEITTLISIGLQLSHNSSSKFLKNFSKSRFLAILSYHYGFSKIN